MKHTVNLILTAVTLAWPFHAIAAVHDTLAHGAKGDGKTVCTEAIQAAIDEAASAGGGEVVFSKPGVYLSGAIFLKSNTELRIEKGVTLRGVQDVAAYPDAWTRVAGVEMNWPSALVNVIEAQNVKLTGAGTIDGDGSFCWEKFWGRDGQSGMMKDYIARGLRWAVDYDCKRVRLIQVYKSKDILVEGLRLERSGFWTVHLCFSQNLICRGLTIRNNIGGLGPSSDGIDVDSSRDVLIEKCDIDCHDDNIVLKAGRDADGLRVNIPTENVEIRDCIARAGYGMVTLGSETSGWIRNVKVHDCKAIGTKHGLYFKSAKVRGGGAENIEFHNLEMEDVEIAFMFNLNWYPAYSYPVIPADVSKEDILPHWQTLTKRVEPEERGIPEYRNILFNNITVKSSGKAFEVVAYPEKPIRGFVWKNVTVNAKEAGSIADAADWSFENVSLTTADGKSVETKNCTGVTPPAAIKP
ncbi:MAG: glycoside hydrolase family 28 protein [Verrucomicrobiota bacterium]